MMWGSKKNTDDGGDEPAQTEDRPSSRRSYDPYDREEAHERSRLLDHPRPPHSDGYLDPDDPAVGQPYLDLDRKSVV